MGLASCCTCVNFMPHDVYEYMGFCVRRGQIVVSDETTCECYRELAFDDIRRALVDRGWVYCVTCRQPIYSMDELEKHIGETIAIGVYVDSVASEDSPPAD